MASSRHLAAIVFTDVVGFTASAQSDEPAALRSIDELDRLCRPVAAEHSGRVVKSTGDGALIEFASVLKAVEFAVALQKQVKTRRLATGGGSLELRVGIHVGDVEQRGDDIVGDAVNVAARVVPLAEPGGICLSGEAAAQVQNKIPYGLEPLAPVSAKGLRHPLQPFRVVFGDSRVRANIGPGVPVPRLAVLPLVNISPDPADAYFADGLTEELIAVLSRIRGLRVLGRTSVEPFRSSRKSVGQVGSELGVTYVLEGSVRKAGSRLRITLQLIETSTEEHSWSETYDRQFDDIFAIQSDVAERTAARLRLELATPGGSVFQRPPTANLTAYASYLRAIHAWHQGRDVGMQPAIDLFEEAIRADPTFSNAYAHLANLLLQTLGDTRPYSEIVPRARSLVQRALELDPESSEAHAARGNLAMQGELDWKLAEEEFQKALQLNPSSAPSHAWYGLLLEVLGRFPESIRQYEAAVELDPGQSIYRLRMAMTYGRMKRFDAAVDLLREQVAARPESPQVRDNLARGLLNARRLDEAAREIDISLELARNLPAASVDELGIPLSQAILAAAQGDFKPLEERLRALTEKAKTEYVPLTRLAAAHARLGHAAEALDLLEKDFAVGDRAFWFTYQDAPFDLVRTDPRFEALVRQSHLPGAG